MDKNNLQSLRRMHGYLHDKRVDLQNNIATDAMISKGYLKSLKKDQQKNTEENYPVDFVVLWLDSTDPKWQQEKNKYLPDDEVSEKSNSAARFRNWDIFKYWFRAVEKYAPWVRNVYLVTYGHYPSFLNLNSPKLKFIKHRDFMPEEYLPTFSCFPTELNLWRIEGISEHIVYFNDDMFLTKPVEKGDFFFNGMPKYSAVALPPYPYYRMSAWKHNLFNNAGIINECFNVKDSMAANPEKWFSSAYNKTERELNLRAYKDGKILGMYYAHVGIPYRCSTMREVWKKIPDRLDSTCRNKFRTMDDTFHQIFQMWEEFNGTFEAVSSDYFGWAVNVAPDNIDRVISGINNERFRMICINDSEIISEEEYQTMKVQLINAFEGKMPEKSSFEK